MHPNQPQPWRQAPPPQGFYQQAPPPQGFYQQAPPPQGFYQQAPPPMQQPMMQQTTVIHQRKDTNHLLHLILTICTAGLWLPVWIVLIIARS